MFLQWVFNTIGLTLRSFQWGHHLAGVRAGPVANVEQRAEGRVAGVAPVDAVPAAAREDQCQFVAAGLADAPGASFGVCSAPVV